MITDEKDKQQPLINNEIEQFLLDLGAVSVGFANKETLAGGPPSTDITYLLSEAESVICFAVPLDKEKIRVFLRKDSNNSRIEHEKDNVGGYIKAFSIAKKAADFLQEKGYKATEIISNFDYRKEVKGWRIILPPVMSLRYLAVRSGVGSFGWSGNVGLKGYGAAILLGGLVTSAKLEPTEPIPPEESFCNNCKLCTKVCAFRMFSDTEEEFDKGLTLGGKTFNFSKRDNVLSCYIVCGGRSGLDKTGKWSTWSPYRHTFPKNVDELENIFTKSFFMDSKTKFHHELENRAFVKSQIKQDPYLKEALSGKKATADALLTLYLTCGNCQLICTGDPKGTKENYNSLIKSGCAVLENNKVKIVSPEEAEKISPMEPIEELSEPQKKFLRVVKSFLKNY